MVFGLVEDDTSAVLKSVWADHPIFLISIHSCPKVFVKHDFQTSTYRISDSNIYYFKKIAVYNKFMMC